MPIRKDDVRRSIGVASIEESTEPPQVPHGHVPSAETAKVLREAKEGKNLVHYESLEEMFKDLGI